MAAEAVPFAKVGGLADVAGALPKALQRLGHDVRVVIPKYQRIQDEQFGLTTIVPRLPVPMNSHHEPSCIKQGRIPLAGERDIPVYLVENERYFGREGVYGYPDDGERFVFFSRAALELLPAIGWLPDVVHCHDWHTAVVPNWLKTVYRDDARYHHMATLLTIHNLAYQGVFGHRVLEVAGLEPFDFLVPRQQDDGQQVDLLARGLHFADAISTVSETHAREILTEEFGQGMDSLLRGRQDRIFGILNGLDEDEFDPMVDGRVAAVFGPDSTSRRAENKLALQREANLPMNPRIPLIGMVSRLSTQKGFDLLAEILEPLLRQPVQLAILGTGEQRFHDLLLAAQKRHPNLAVFLTFSTRLAQKIYAGSDMFLMPSRFEPCGLGQLVAMRYGSVPIVRRTGGLADTVQDFDASADEGSGFVFDSYDPMELFAAIIRATETYKHRDLWRRLQRHNMQRDFSWPTSAARYAAVYEQAVAFQRADALRAG